MVAITATSGPSTTQFEKKKQRQKKKVSKTANLDSEHQIHDDDDDLLPTDTTGFLNPSEPAPHANTNDDDDDVMIDDSTIQAPSSVPVFPPLPASAQMSSVKAETRRIAIPPHRLTPLKKDWINIFSPLTEMCGLQVRMNTVRRCVEIRVGPLFACVAVERTDFSERRQNIRRRLEPYKEVLIL